jgi:hypothetical protein
MSTMETIKNERFLGYRILALAIGFSFAWHVFWLLTIKVVAPSPAHSSEVRFSKVSFLGQIFSKVGMEVRSQPAERSLLERRYNAFAADLDRRSGRTLVSTGQKPEEGKDSNPDTDRTMVYLINEAVSGPKAEPDHGSW